MSTEQKPITVKQLNALNPSWDNPIELECFDRYYRESFREIKVITPVIKGKCAVLNKREKMVTFLEHSITHYTLKKPEPNIELAWPCYGAGGVIALYFEDGSYPQFGIEEKSSIKFPDNLSRKVQGLPPVKINMDTWEIVE